MSLRFLAAAATTAVALAVPATAQAGLVAYQPFHGTDPSGDSSPANPVVDLTTVDALHGSDRFKVTVAFDGLEPKKYTRYLVGLGEMTDKVSYVEMRTGREGTTSTRLYTADFENGVFRETRCNNVKAIPDYTAGTILFVLPLSCYRGTDPNGTQVQVATGKWTSGAWTKGSPFDAVNPDAGGDNFVASWDWFVSPVRHARTAARSPFGAR